MPFVAAVMDAELKRVLEQEYLEQMREAMLVPGKFEKEDAVKAVRTLAFGEFAEFASPGIDRKKEIIAIFADMEKREARRMIAEEGRRVDGRKLDEIRPITGEVGVLPRTHGSALFTRGETQALAVTTLGTSEDEQIIDDLGLVTRKRFMLHYNFPPFSTGEASMLRGTTRRETGHGALAERAIRVDAAGEGQVPLHDPHRLRHPRVQRLLLDGHGLRRHALADGRRRADQGPGGRHRDGARRRGRRLPHPLGHPGRRGPLRRHGLQGRRHRGRDHRAADGPQGQGADPRGHGPRAGARPARAGCTSSARWPRR